MTAAVTFRLRQQMRPPASTRSGALTWRWRAETPLHGADLNRRASDDSPIRVVITFQDGRVRAAAAIGDITWTGP